MKTNRESVFHIGETIFRVVYSDITTRESDVIVSSDDGFLSMGGGVSYAICHKAGEGLREEVKKHIPLDIGSVAITSSGNLKSKYIFHAVTIDYRSMKYLNEEYLAVAVKRCLTLAQSLGNTSISFPALGTGVARFPFEKAAEVMTGTITEFLQVENSSLTEVELCLFPREMVSIPEVDLFYEKASAIAATIAQNQQLSLKIVDLKKLLIDAGKESLVPLLDEIQNSIYNENIHLEKVKLGEQDFFRKNTINDKIDNLKVISKSVKSHKVLELELLKTKLSGLYTKMNLNQTTLNIFLVEEAKFGGVMVPPRLVHSINDVNAEMLSLQEEINGLKTEIDNIS